MTQTPKPFTVLQSQGSARRAQGDRTLAEQAQQFDVHPNQITQWKQQWSKGQPRPSIKTRWSPTPKHDQCPTTKSESSHALMQRIGALHLA